MNQFNLPLTILVAFLFIIPTRIYAQNPNTGIFFQAIARDQYANPAKDRRIYVQSSIVQSTATGTKVLIEEYQTTTDAYGVFSISIGQGTRIGGTVANLGEIEWVRGPYYLNLKISITPMAPVSSWDYTKDWIELGTSPFGTVPYALYSGSSGALDSKLSITDTATMLAIYAKAKELKKLSDSIDNKISITDTAKMLAPYAKAVNALIASNITSLTAATVNNALNTKVNLADSLIQYVTPTQLAQKTFDSASIINRIVFKLNLTDTATMLGNYAKNLDVTRNYNTKLNLVDTATMLNDRFSRDTLSLSNRINERELLINKSKSVAIDASSDIKYPSNKAVKLYVDSVISLVGSGGGGSNATVVDADALTKGKIQLSGDLTGTADAPVIVNGAITNAKIATGISASKVGLGNVNNTSDLDKPVSTAQQAAIDLKYNANSAAILSTRIDTKLNLADTSAMLNDRIKRDTISLSNRINTKMSASDSATLFVTPYQLNNSLPDITNLNNRIDLKYATADAVILSNLVATKINKTDTVNLSDRINLKVNYTDSIRLFATATQLQKLKDDTITLSNRINERVKITDTARMLQNYAIKDALSTIAITGNYNDLINKPTIATVAVTSVNTLTGDVVIDKTSLDLGNVENTSDLNKPISSLTSNALNNKVDLSSLNTPNGIVGLDGNTKIPSYLLPSLSFTSVSIASSNTEMIAIGMISSKGTVCVRTDLSKTFVLSVDYGGLVTDWIEMLTPGSPVQSVNGKTGTLNINTGDLSESGNLFFTNSRARLSLTVNTPLQYNAGTGVIGIDTSNSNSSLVSRWSLNQQNNTNTSNLALKVTISDTSNMLYPYTRNNNLTSILNTKLNLTDTADMLANYLSELNAKEYISNRSSDTSLGGSSASNLLYPTQYAVKKYLENNVSGGSGTIEDATSTEKGKIQLAGDLGGTAAAPIVLSIAGISKDTLANTVNIINAATSKNIVNYIVRRSPIGDFSGSTISANTFRGNLIGTVTGNLTGNLTGDLIGTVTGNATNVSGVVAIANGGTGASLASSARSNLGLSEVDNISDANKQVSSAQKAALDLKANLNSPTFTGLPILPTGTAVVTQALNDNSTKIASTEYVANALGDASGSITNSVQDATTTSKGKILLAGDLGGTGSSPLVLSIGDKTKDEIVFGITLVNNATNNNLANSIVKRDANGAFSGNLLGNATNVTSTVAILNGGTGATTVAGFKTNFGLDNIDNTNDLNKPISTLTQSALDTKMNTSVIGISNGVASLGSDGKVPTAQLPAFSIASVNVINSQSNMLALIGLSVGAVAIRTDNATNYLLTALPATTLSNWQIFYPASTNVQSVNGSTGAVVLSGAVNKISVSSNVFDIASTYTGQSSIITVGTIATGSWNATAIGITKGGTGATTAAAGFNALAPSQSGQNGKFLTTNGSSANWSTISSAGGWSTSGNTGIIDGTNFIGTTDAQPLNFRVNNISAGRIDTDAIIGQTTFGYGAGANTLRSTTVGKFFGTKNTSIGYQTIFNTVSGKENTALGYQALLSNTSGSSTTAIGFQAMMNANDFTNSTFSFETFNTAIGYQALMGSITPASNTGKYNSATGYATLKNITGGFYNTANGYNALTLNTIGISNTAIGAITLSANISGSYNTAIGRSLSNNTTGSNNTAVGYNTLNSNITGDNNTALGFQANIIGDISNSMVLGNGAYTSAANTIQLGNSSIVKVNTSGAIVSSNATVASSATTGALIIAGGAGIRGALFVGGNFDIAGSSSSLGLATFNNGITSSSVAANSFNNLTVTNISTLATTNISGPANISNANISSGTSNGALVVSGGVGIGGTVNIGGAANIGSNLTVTNTTRLNSISYGTTPVTNNNSTQLATTAYVMSTLASPANGFAWSTTGNANITDGSKYFGTTDAQPLNFIVNNIPAGRIDTDAIIGQTTFGYGAGANTLRSTTVGKFFGTKNTSIGYQTIFNTVSGKENTALGYQALLSNTSGSSTTAIGFQAMMNANDFTNSTFSFETFNTAIGYQALMGSITPASNTGKYNSATGYATLKNITGGFYNTANGYNALTLNTIGISNTAIGAITLSANISGSYNTAIGRSLSNNTTGSNNTAVGYNTLNSNITGDNNTALGFQANIIGDISNSMVLGNGAYTSAANTIQLGNSSIVKVNTSGAIVSSNATVASSATTGALIIAGGAGIRGALFVGGNFDIAGSSSSLGLATFNNGITSSSVAANSFNNLTVTNISTLATTNISGPANISNANISSGTSNGALVVSGGVGIGGTVNIGGAANIGSNLTVTNTTRLNSISYGTTPVTNNNSTQLATTAYVMSTLASPANGFAWSTTGNANITDGSKYFGTTDAQPLNFRVNNISAGRIDASIDLGQTSFGFGAGSQTLKETITPFKGTKNSIYGYQAMYNTINGKENTVMGYQALLNNGSGSSSIAIGFQAMMNYNNSTPTTDFISYNTAVGYQALMGSAIPASNTGTNNLALGYQVLKANTTGSNNNAIGNFVMSVNTSGGNNIAIGNNALINNTTGNYNIALGRIALNGNISGIGNIGIGYNTMSSNTIGNYNTAIGYGANITRDITNATSIGNGATNATANSIQLGNTSVVIVNTSGTIITSADINAKHIKGNSGALSIVASTGAGISPSNISVAGTDISGIVALTTGNSPSINAILATITYNTVFSTAPVVVITPANAATASLVAAQAVWININTANFTINTNATAVNANTIYKWNYVVIQ